MRASLREHVIVFLKGVAMGTADAVPGASGGTIALITGIYERLIAAITALDPRVLRHTRGIHRPDGRRTLREELQAMDLPFLLVLGAGIATALIVVSRLAYYALGTARAATFAFFFGLIAASAIVLYGEIGRPTPGRILAALAGFGLAFFVAGLSGSGILSHSLPAVFLAGTVGISAMVLPGISGAAILVLLGQYEHLNGTLTAFVDALIALPSGGSVDAVLDPGTTVVTFLAGAVIGLMTVAHAVKRALEAYRRATLAFLVSLLVGTLRLPVVEIWTTVESWDATALAVVVAVTAVGALAVLALDHYTDDLSY